MLKDVEGTVKSFFCFAFLEFLRGTMNGNILEKFIREALSNVSPSILNELVANGSTSKVTTQPSCTAHELADGEEVVLDIKKQDFTAAQLLQPRKPKEKATDAQNTFNVS